MKTRLLSILLLAVCAILCACDTPQTPEEAARRQRYEMLGDRLLNLGLAIGKDKGIITKQDAAYLREFGSIVITTPPVAKPEPAPLPEIETTSGK
jgi:hypothetical protein